MTDSEFQQKRAELVELIAQAAELEHALCCVYLFAAFSMKLEPDPEATLAEIELLRRWKGTQLSIARQEMEHLAITSNLLTAIGEAPNLRRPDFPTNRREYPLDVPVQLRAFSLESLGHFLIYEIPHRRTRQEEQLREFLRRPDHLEADTRLLHQLQHVDRKDGIEALYTKIKRIFTTLGSTPGGEARLFVGPPSAQVGNALVYETYPEVPNNQRVYDVLVATATNTSEALAAIDQVQLEGEGSVSEEAPTGGHFVRFSEMYQALSTATRAAHDAGRELTPGRNVGPNPKLPGYQETAPAKPGVRITEITDPVGRQAVEIYERAYTLLLKMLIRFFGMTDQDTKATIGLQTVAFFPLMTLVMRPLGDMLAELPAQPDSDLRAGPAYDCGRSVSFIPHAAAAWNEFYAELMSLSEATRDLSQEAALPPVLQPRLQFMAENFWRMGYNLAGALGMELPR